MQEESPQLFNCLMHWFEVFCWPFFLKSVRYYCMCKVNVVAIILLVYFHRSQLYCKYRLCCILGNRSNVDERAHSSSQQHPHDQVGMSFVDFIHFEKELEFTVASSLIALWVCCEGHHLGVQQQWATQHTIRLYCLTLPFLSDMVGRIFSH